MKKLKQIRVYAVVSAAHSHLATFRVSCTLPCLLLAAAAAAATKNGKYCERLSLLQHSTAQQYAGVRLRIAMCQQYVCAIIVVVVVYLYSLSLPCRICNVKKARKNINDLFALALIYANAICPTRNVNAHK